MRRIFVCSPFRPRDGRTGKQNIQLVEDLCLAVLQSGRAPFAPHALYPHLLDDNIETERDTGIAAGLAWLSVCDEVWVWSKHGVPEGMAKEIAFADSLEIPVKLMPQAFQDFAVANPNA